MPEDCLEFSALWESDSILQMKRQKCSHLLNYLAYTVAQKTIPMFGHFEKMDLPEIK